MLLRCGCRMTVSLSLSLMDDSCNYATLFKGRTGCLCLAEDKICKHMPDSGLFYMTRAAGRGGTPKGTPLVFHSVAQSGLLALPGHSLSTGWAGGGDKREPSRFFVLSIARRPPDRGKPPRVLSLEGPAGQNSFSLSPFRVAVRCPAPTPSQ